MDISGPVGLAVMCDGSSRSGRAAIAGTTIGGCPVERSSRPCVAVRGLSSNGSVSVGVRAGP